MQKTNFPHLQTRRQFPLLQIAGYFDAKYSGRFIYNAPFITIYRWQSLDLFELQEGESEQSEHITQVWMIAWGHFSIWTSDELKASTSNLKWSPGGGGIRKWYIVCSYCHQFNLSCQLILFVLLLLGLLGLLGLRFHYKIACQSYSFVKQNTQWHFWLQCYSFFKTPQDRYWILWPECKVSTSCS